MNSFNQPYPKFNAAVEQLGEHDTIKNLTDGEAGGAIIFALIVAAVLMLVCFQFLLEGGLIILAVLGAGVIIQLFFIAAATVGFLWTTSMYWDDIAAFIVPPVAKTAARVYSFFKNLFSSKQTPAAA